MAVSTPDHLIEILGAGVGDSIGDGWVLSGVEPVGRTGAFAVILSRANGPARSLEILLTPRPDPDRHYAVTRRFAVAYRAAGGPGGAPPPIVDRVVDRIRAGEARVDAPPDGAEFLLALPSRPTLFLLPGHIGHPLDIGSRTLDVLARVEDVFVEEGLLEEARALMRSFHIADGRKRYVEIAKDPARNAPALARLGRLFSEGRHACIFGVGEGMPCFLDPGTDLVGEAARIGFGIQGAGGPSSLSSALLRIGLPVDEFTVLGRLEGDGDLERISGRLAEGSRLPCIVFTEGLTCPTLLARLLASHRFSRVVLLAELTTEREASIEIDLGHDVGSQLRGLDPGLRIVAFLVPRTPASGAFRPLRLGRRIARRVVDRLTGRRG